MTVRDLWKIMEGCWFRIKSDTLEDENGDCLTLFDECHHEIFPKALLDRPVKRACISDDNDLGDCSEYLDVYI